MTEPITIRLNSRDTVELDLDLFLQNGEIDVFPHVESRGLLFLNFRKSKVALSGGPYVGLIPLTPNIVVDVRPKLPVSNISRVLDVARASVDHLPGFSRFYLSEASDSSSVYSFLVRNLLSSLEPVFSNGLLKEFNPLIENSSRIRGRIDLRGTMGACWSRGHLDKVQTKRFEQQIDTAVNRVIKSALEFALTRSLSVLVRESALLTRTCEAFRFFPGAVGRASQRDINSAQRVLDRRLLQPSRSYYYRSIDIALLILSERRVSLDLVGNDIELGTFIVNFEDLFEEYLRFSLFSRAALGFQVLDGNTEGKKPLFDNDGAPFAQPDIVLRETETGKTLIAEVKYKEKPNRNDINQAITYAVTYGTDVALLIHQKKTDTPGGLNSLGAIGGIKLLTYSYDLSNPDLESEEIAFSEQLFNLTRSL
ncbi:McrC family protein [Phaeobacter inhibens]|uniref:McrC family protein n=1 Tax=Phaeobacter inhibens TaxID=221822 RepID=UPI0021A7A156|nr:McrC family protein [Phaeobacter inhibens]UWR76649.1 McrC family protein [Phaeobacter inhibens]